MGTVHFHRVATQGGDEGRVRARRGQHERGRLTLRKGYKFQFVTGRAIR